MKPVLLTDFGSTYTKLTAVDADGERLLGTASAYTTVRTDIGEGFDKALEALTVQTGKLAFEASYACSSAAGGLRMIVSGLVPELTMEAARLASLGAGAKVIRQYSFELTGDDLAEIESERPDIFLLVGGTDGGNEKCILHNAELLASIKPSFPVIVAGNRSAARACERLLAGCECCVCANVMPRFGVLRVEETQSCIRDIFLRRIIQAKGLSRVSGLFSDILMPTPAAVLAAVKLLADGCEGEPGIGELVAVDVGGATTDVYSVAEGMPRQMNRVFKGLPEPYAKRTVDGDIGMRYSIRGIVDAAGLGRICELSGLPRGRAEELIDFLARETETVPNGDPELEALDYALASLAVECAMTRHAGTIEETYTMLGQTFVQTGKDLSGVGQIVVTGGSLIHSGRTAEIARHALFDPMQPQSLRPRRAGVLIDRSYILAAMGLLSVHDPRAALHIMKKELSADGHSEP